MKNVQKPSDEEKNNPSKPDVTLGLALVVGMLVFASLGLWLDKKFGQEDHWWTLGGIFLGLIYGAYEIYKTIQRMNK